MAKCQVCGKKGLFLKLTGGLCPDCIATAQRQWAAAQAAKAATATVPKSKKSTAPKKHEGKTYRVTGVQHYTANLLKLAVSNPNYTLKKQELLDSGLIDQTIWKNEFHPVHVDVIPEPANPYDPNAIKVVVDGEHVGYIKAGSCAHLLKVIREDRIQKIDCEITGGAYKELIPYEEPGDYEFDRSESPYRVTLYITEA